MKLTLVLVALALWGCVSPNNQNAVLLDGARLSPDGGAVTADGAVVTADAAVVTPDAVLIPDAPGAPDVALIPDAPSCGLAQHMCGQTCYANDDPGHCGVACTSCPSLPNGTPVCSALGPSCQQVCNSGSVACQDTPGVITECATSVWDFEDGSVAGWEVDDHATSTDSALNGTVQASTDRAHGGRYALRVPVGISSGNRIHLEALRCSASGGWAEQRGATATFLIFIDGAPAGTSSFCGGGGFGLDADGKYQSFGPSNGPITVPNGQWAAVSSRFDEAAAAHTLRFYLDCRLASDVSWSGNVYIDDISVN